MKRPLWILLAAAVLYLALAPVAIEPRAWEAPRSTGYVGPHEVNDRLSGLELLALGDHQGPEDVVVSSPHPLLRRVVQRLPPALRPRARLYGHLIAIDDAGSVVHDLQDPEGAYPMVTAAAESGSYLWAASLQGRHLARLDRSRVNGLR